MRRFSLALCVLAGIAHPAFGDSAITRISIALDWSKVHEQEVLTNKFQEAGLLPLPMIFVQGKLRALVPSSIDVASAGTPIEIDIGVAQIVERPLYVVHIAQTATGAATAQLASLDLAVVDHSGVVEGERTAVVLKGISHSEWRMPSYDGTAYLALPAAPFAALAAFALKTTNGMVEGRVVPLVLQNNKQMHPPFPQVVPNSIDWEQELHSPFTQLIYQETISQPWAAKWLPLAAKKQLDWTQPPSWLKAPPQLSIELRSVPAGADVYVAGNRHSDDVTNVTIQEPKELWDDISLRMKLYRDCPIDSCEETAPSGSGGTPIFTCKLQRQ